MGLLSSLPSEVVNFVMLWVIPLFILFNIIGWVDLPRREANRSAAPPSEEESSDLARSIWAAWLLGLLLSLVGLTALYKFYVAALQTQNLSRCPVLIAGTIGLVLGIIRGIFPRIPLFRNRSALNRRRILALCIVGAVAVSIACAVVYYDGISGHLARSVIAAGYAWMLISYAATFVFEVGK